MSSKPRQVFEKKWLKLLKIAITDYRSSFRFKKFKMADPIWRSRFIKINQIYLTAILDPPIRILLSLNEVL